MNWILMCGLGSVGGVFLYGIPCIYKMSGLNLALQ